MTKYRIYYFLLFLRFFPSYLSIPIPSINFSFLLLPFCLISPNFKRILNSLSIRKYKILIPLLILGLIQFSLFGFATLKTTLFISSSFLGSIFLATIFTSVSIKKQIDTILLISTIISLIFLPVSFMQEGSILFGSLLPTMHGVAGFGAISGPIYIYVFYLLTTYKINFTYKLSRIFVNTFLLIASANSSDTILCLIFFFILGITYSTKFPNFDRLFKNLLKNRLIIFCLILIPFLIGTLALGLYISNLSQVAFIEFNAMSNDRARILIAAFERFDEMSPKELLFGQGFSLGQYHFYDNSPILQEINIDGHKQIHNSFITLIYDSGIIGITLYLISLFNLVFPLFRKMNNYFLKLNTKNNHNIIFSFNATKLASISLILSLSGMDKHTDLLIYTCIVMIPLNYLRFNKLVNF